MSSPKQQKPSSPKSNTTNEGGDVKEIVNVLAMITNDIFKARSIMKQKSFQNISTNAAEMAAFPTEIVDIMREAAEVEEFKKFSEFCKIMNDVSKKVEVSVKNIKSIQSNTAVQALETTQPERQRQTQLDYMDQIISLLYTINLEFRKVLLAGNASYIHGLSYIGDGVSSTETLIEETSRLLALVSNATVDLL